MGRGGCRAVQCLLEVINVIFIVCGITLVVTGGVFVYQTIGLPGPASTAALCAIILGFVTVCLGMFGYKAAEQRKILHQEFKGKIKLFIYAVILGSVLISLLGVGIILFVWLDGTVPDSGFDNVNSIAAAGIEKADAPVHNFVGCFYDVCCINQVSNRSTFKSVSCKMDNEGSPDINGEEVFGPNTAGDDIDPSKYQEASDSCVKFADVFDQKNCEEGSYACRQAVGQWLNKTIKPMAIVIIIFSLLMFVAFLFSVLEIFWCCGESDLPPEDEEDPTKIYPEEDYEDY